MFVQIFKQTNGKGGNRVYKEDPSKRKKNFTQGILKSVILDNTDIMLWNK